MHSDPVEKSASPRKRIVSRAMSEEESLRHIIEAEESPKRLSRRDSRYGSLRRGETRGSQSEDEPAENTSMMELQQNYEMCLAELQSIELRQEVLLFQVECLQDALEGAEEMLTESKREAHQFSMELEREREQRRKLENDVASLTQELERLKEEKVSVPAESIIQEQKEAAVITDNPDADDVDGCESNEIKSEDTPSQPTVSTNSFANFAATAYLLFKNRRLEPILSRQAAADGTTVDEEVKNTHAVGSEGSSRKSHDGEDYDESSGYEDAPSDFSPSTPDGSSDAGLPEDGESELKNSNEARNVRDPDACLLS
ncbi:hypothetical protein KOW79_017507 [Hemibagrus wyckioides]|uniref:Uncharacterized protein n=1 Tax=Hemibagrus wyckioides TaxID=337641 RepID=A0A9D3NCZ5_9TELE|nr:uncharacterized protein si:ch1073-456m8.1 [Hemibagrus wyckioides]KAG7319033.1 hypothetical protein KOW79_017507 [Hemibagrus wyckioides]